MAVATREIKLKKLKMTVRWLDGIEDRTTRQPRLSRMAQPPATRPPRAPRPPPLATQHRPVTPTDDAHVPPPAVDKKTGGRQETRPAHDPFSNDLLPFWIYRWPGK